MSSQKKKKKKLPKPPMAGSDDVRDMPTEIDAIVVGAGNFGNHSFIPFYVIFV